MSTLRTLFSALVVAAFASPAFAADAPKSEVKTEAKPAASAAGGNLVTPQSDAAALKDAIAKLRSTAKPKVSDKPAETPAVAPAATPKAEGHAPEAKK